MTADLRGLPGVWVDALIPLNPDLTPHHGKLATHIRTLAVKGIQGIVLFGPAGEGLSFSATERLETVKQLITHGVSGHDIVLHTGFPSVTETLDVMGQAHKLGLRGCIVTPPHSEEAPTQEGLAHFFNQIAERASGLSTHLYLASPYRSGTPDLKPNVVQEVLSQHAGAFVGMIDQTRNASHMQDWLRLYSAKLPIYTNDELQVTALAKQGLHSCVSSWANLIPSVMTGLVTPPNGIKTSVAGNAIGADDGPLLHLAHMLEGLPEVSALKFLMSVHYHDADWQRVRPPLSGLLPQSQETLLKDFKKYFPTGGKA
jgi:dihydrodipicolinate synthase/N-acetylneuraminate lyase